MQSGWFMEERIILVDSYDKETGTMEKLAAHFQGKLHRAFSVFIFNGEGQLLLQKRAATKYHSGGLWSNTCCSHPKPGETMEQAVQRRLMEEMGFACPTTEIFCFTYRAKLDNGIVENEYDHILVGKYTGQPKANPDEAEDWKWADIDDLKLDRQRYPEEYTYWFNQLLDDVVSHLSSFRA